MMNTSISNLGKGIRCNIKSAETWHFLLENVLTTMIIFFFIKQGVLFQEYYCFKINVCKSEK